MPARWLGSTRLSGTSLVVARCMDPLRPMAVLSSTHPSPPAAHPSARCAVILPTFYVMANAVSDLLFKDALVLQVGPLLTGAAGVAQHWPLLLSRLL